MFIIRLATRGKSCPCSSWCPGFRHVRQRTQGHRPAATLAHQHRLSRDRQAWPRRLRLAPGAIGTRSPDHCRSLYPYHLQNRAVGEIGQQPRHDLGGHRHAALGRRKAGPREVEEDGAAAPAAARRNIPVEHQAIIVKTIRATHRLVACAVRNPDRPVVVAVIRDLAPAQSGMDLAHGEARASCRHVIPAKITRQDAHRAKRRGAVALALVGRDSAAPERAGKHRATGDEKALGWVAGTRAHRQAGKARAASGSGRFFALPDLYLYFFLYDRDMPNHRARISRRSAQTKLRVNRLTGL